MYRIAVVDDNEAWCFVVANLFQQHGYHVSTFTDAASFLRRADKFDIALIDFSIPPRRYQKETDGPEIIRFVKERSPNPPITILISAYFTEDILPGAQDICPEADAFLTKDAGLEKILHRVKEILATKSNVSVGKLHSSMGSSRRAN